MNFHHFHLVAKPRDEKTAHFSADTAEVSHWKSLFCELSDVCWDRRYAMSTQLTNYEACQQAVCDLYYSSFDAASELLKLRNLDEAFSMDTAYNPFTLLRNMARAESRYNNVTSDYVRHTSHRGILSNEES
jgi:hypothetical protein